jgi:hypothetical protein
VTAGLGLCPPGSTLAPPWPPPPASPARRAILQEGKMELRTQYLIENLFAIRKVGFAEFEKE